MIVIGIFDTSSGRDLSHVQRQHDRGGEFGADDFLAKPLPKADIEYSITSRLRIPARGT
jgi:hypothetical protein